MNAVKVKMMMLNLMSALLIGFASSAHCVFMCGGISAAFRAAPGLSAGQQNLLGFMFQFGRLLSYGLIGLLLGGLMVTAGQVSGLGLLLRTLAGLLLIGMGLYLANIWHGLAWLEKPLAPAWRKVSAHASRWLPVRQVRHALAIGAIWGWLPCGLVYSTLAWAATTSSTAWESGLLMIAMGIGTLPAMLGISFFSRVLRKKISRTVAGFMLCLFGLWTLWMPLQSLTTGTVDHSEHGQQMHTGH
ncbi:MAG: sulfite exporter TauE/SafE family protein [Pseudomonadales bacterium]